MISCESFRARFRPGTEDAELLGHLRSCDRCLDLAIQADPDVMFRAIGGEAMVPPGGVDAFVDGVMQQVRVRAAEQKVVSGKVIAWPQRLAIAATIAAGITGAVLFTRLDTPAIYAPVQVASRTLPARSATAAAVTFATKPVVETYESSDSQNATIVEMPSEAANDVKIVMIFDENLPADL